MKTLAQLNEEIAAATAHYRAIADTANALDLRTAIDAVRNLQNEREALITKGANPCPDCGGEPRGLQQGDAFEVGCPHCGWFLHTDGTARDHGAVAPRQKWAVESWNDGPDFWKKPSANRFSPAEVAALPPRGTR